MIKTIQLILTILILNSCLVSQDKLTKIPRTRVSISIPNDYSIMNINPGLKKDEHQAIIIMDIIGGNYYSSIETFNKHDLELEGLTVYSFEDTSVSGFPAKIVTTNTDDEKLSSIIVVFGDTSFSTIITSIHEANDKKLENYLKKIILSIEYDKERVFDPFEEALFTVDTLSTNFKFDFFASNMYLFKPKDGDSTDVNSKITLTPNMFDSTMTVEQTSLMGIYSLKKHGAYGIITHSTTKYKVDGADALLKSGDLYIGVDNMYFHQLILAKDDLMLIVFAMCDFEDEEMKNEIYKFCNLIRIKN